MARAGAYQVINQQLQQINRESGRKEIERKEKEKILELVLVSGRCSERGFLKTRWRP